MKRMICFVSDQLLPNFIPVNEAITRPDALHAVFTPNNSRMVEKWLGLKTVLARKFPPLDSNETVEVASAYDAADIMRKCESLLRKYPDDDWSLNMTGGTKLMSAPAVEVFRRENLPIYYVETPRSLTLKISPPWQVSELPFTGFIELETYFELHGRTVTVGKPKTGQEGEVFRRLEKLEWRQKVYPSVDLYDKSSTSSRGPHMAEYDAIGILHYQLYVFECKKLNVTKEAVRRHLISKGELDRAKDDILFDLYKLSQVQKSFGGPFGRSYWIFSGKTRLEEVNQSRIKEFGITLIRGNEINDILREPQRFGLPSVRWQTQLASGS